MPDHNIEVLQTGDTGKTNPYTIAITNNPAYEISGHFTRDPINDARQSFERSARYIFDCLFGRLPQQAERFLTEPAIRSKIRVVSLWTEGLAADEQNALIFLYGSDFRARRQVFKSFFGRFDLNPDVAFAVTNLNEPRLKASAYWSLDDEASGGARFTFDGATYTHHFDHLEPGAVAIHADDTSLTALHEFSHAASSEQNGYVADLYYDGNFVGSLTANKKKRRGKIPQNFAEYNGATYRSNPKRGYGSTKSYHAELIDSRFPALMDWYIEVENGVPEQCRHDKLTRQFLLDRIKAKTER